MKTILLTFTILCSLCISTTTFAQVDEIDKDKTYVVIKNDGTEYVGQILSKDGREVLILTKTVGKIYIPMHEIKEIREVDETDINEDGTVLNRKLFSTRYFITPNALPSKKGDAYIIWNLFGPDMQFTVADNLTIGVLTTWVGSPIIGSVKYRLPITAETSKAHLAVGTLLGTGSWASLNSFIGLPYASFTYGDRIFNITTNAGYGYASFDGDGEGRMMLGIGSMIRLGSKVSFVFDSVIFPALDAEQFSGSMLIPGIRIQTKPERSFQFGFAGFSSEGELFPLPIPVVQFFQKL